MHTVHRLCVCVCLSITSCDQQTHTHTRHTFPQKIAGPIKVLFAVQTWVAPGNQEVGCSPDPPRGGGNSGAHFPAHCKVYGISGMQLMLLTLFIRWSQRSGLWLSLTCCYGYFIFLSRCSKSGNCVSQAMHV